MMTRNKLYNKMRVLLLIPLASLIFLGAACVNGQHKPEVVTAIAPTRLNVMYIGVDNPVKIAVSGYQPSEIDVTVTNGMIRGELGDYIVNPKRPIENVKVIVTHKGDTLQVSEFRVKKVPNPVAIVNGKTGGHIKKEYLLNAEFVSVYMENFDFDLHFEITGFTVSATIKGQLREATSNADFLTEEQKKLINDLEKDQHIYFQDIKCKGPDGTERELNPLVFKITE